eukprot:365377-Chlamydomonas_euryale.AAC.25
MQDTTSYKHNSRIGIIIVYLQLPSTHEYHESTTRAIALPEPTGVAEVGAATARHVVAALNALHQVVARGALAPALDL